MKEYNIIVEVREEFGRSKGYFQAIQLIAKNEEQLLSLLNEFFLDKIYLIDEIESIMELPISCVARIENLSAKSFF